MVSSNAYDNPEKPRLYRRAPLELSKAAVNDDENFLRYVVDKRLVNTEPPEARPHECKVRVVDLLERQRHAARSSNVVRTREGR